ncbi:MAG: hypothetical protein AAF193_12425, partial [Bacteroidota bacterium]
MVNILPDSNFNTWSDPVFIKSQDKKALVVGLDRFSSTNSIITSWGQKWNTTFIKKDDHWQSQDGAIQIRVQNNAAVVSMSELDISTPHSCQSCFDGWTGQSPANWYSSSFSPSQLTKSAAWSADIDLKGNSIQFSGIQLVEQSKQFLASKKSWKNVLLNYPGMQQMVQTKTTIDLKDKLEHMLTEEDLVDFFNEQSQWETSSELVATDLTWDWMGHSLCKFYLPNSADPLLITEVQDSSEFSNAIVQYPNIELIENNNAYFLKWSDSDIFKNSIPTLGIEANQGFLRGDYFIVCNSMNTLMEYARKIDRQEDSTTESNALIQESGKIEDDMFDS